MSAVAVDAPSRQELVARAEALKPLLAGNAAEAEETRRIPDENIAAVRDAGLFKIMTPRRFGGYEVPFETKLAVSAKLAEACGSTAWVVTLTNVCGWMVGLSCARVRADTGWAIRKAREAIDTAISANGASSFADVSPLQRLWRDANTAGRHAVVQPSVNQEVYGKALLGIPYEDNIAPLI